VATGSLFPAALGFDAAERFVCRRFGLNFRSVSIRRVLDGSFAFADGPAIPVVHFQRVEADLDGKGAASKSAMASSADETPCATGFNCFPSYRMRIARRAVVTPTSITISPDWSVTRIRFPGA
jgi:hypothetical protein